MKNIAILISLFIIAGTLFSQEMKIHKTGGVTETILLSDIDSITFVEGAITPNCGIVTDADGNNYNTVTIGTQCWMQQNLKTTKYRDNTPIQTTTDNAAWVALTVGGYCDYNNTPSYSDTYGRLYNFYAVVDTRHLCPTGWHVPTDGDWTTLTTYLGGVNVAGAKLKETGTSHWQSPNAGATNETGFTLLPAGNRYGTGTYGSLGVSGNMSTSTARDATTYWLRYFNYNSTAVVKDFDDNTDAFSVRCIKD